MNDQLKSILEQQLRDAQTPTAISEWPAIGWWVVLLIALCTITVSLLILLKHHRKNAHRKMAITELNNCFNIWQKHKNDSRYLQGANSVLKRVYLHISDDSIGLSGEAWLKCLNTHATSDFSRNTSLALTHQLYQEKPSSDINLVHKEVTAWLRQHRLKLPKQKDQTVELQHA